MGTTMTPLADSAIDVSSLDKDGLDRFIQERGEAICHAGAEIGSALKLYRDKLFFKPEFNTFEEYCQERWNFKRSHAHTLIKNSEVRANITQYVNKLIESGEMSTIVDAYTMLPAIESHYTALSTAASEYQGELWIKVNSELPEGEQLTAQKILDEALKYTMSKKPRKPPLGENAGGSGKKTGGTGHSNANAEPDDNDQQENIEPPSPPEPSPTPQPSPDDQPTPSPAQPDIKTFGDFDTHEPSEDNSDDQEPIEPQPLTETSQVPPATAPGQMVHGRNIRITKLPAPVKPFGMALVSKKHAKETPFNLLDGCVGQLKPGGRIAYFCTLIEAFDAIRSAESLESVLKFEHFVVRQIEPDPETPDTVVFPVATQAILLFKFEPKGTTAPAANTGNLIGLTNLWRMELKDATYTLLDAFVSPGDRVFCPTGGNDFIRESINWGCEVEYLCDESKAEHYRGMFGG